MQESKSPVCLLCFGVWRGKIGPLDVLFACRAAAGRAEREVMVREARLMCKSFLFRAFVLAVIVIFGCNSVVCAAVPVASVEIETEAGGGDTVVTFGHPFKAGQVDETVRLQNGADVVPARVDVKRRHPDGSVKHAVISAQVGRAASAAQVLLDMYAAQDKESLPAKPPVLPDGFSAEVGFVFPDGSRRTASAVEFLEKASAGVKGFRKVDWLAGPLVSEVQVSGPPLDSDGRGDPDLQVIFGLRVLKGGKSVRVEVVVESPWMDVPGNIPYDVKVSVGGKEVMSKQAVGHWRHRMPYWLKDADRGLGHFAHARWRKVFWWGEKSAKTHVRYDLGYLVSTGLIPPYDTKLVISQDAVAKGVSRWRNSPRDILENGIIMAYFPTTGGREDLGPYPGWTTRYLLSADKETWRIVLGTGDLAGSFGVHMRDRKDGRIFSIDEHPGFSLNTRGTYEKIPPRDASDRPYVLPAASPYSVDNAPQPSLAFIPYLLTGDYYYLEEMYFWANWCMLIQNAAYRQKDLGLLAPDQMRGEAWALRQLVDAAKIAPDDHPEKEYFDNKVKNNLRYYCEFVKGPDATPLGTYTVGSSDAYVRGRSQEERQKWLTLAPWQQNFLVWSLDHAVRAGYEEAAAPRDYFAGTEVGVLTHAADFDPQYGASYFLVVGERIEGKKRWYRTWKELFDKSFRVVSLDAKGGLASNYGSSYSYIARAVLLLGRHNRLTGAQQALEVLEANLANRQDVLVKDPTWAFAP